MYLWSVPIQWWVGGSLQLSSSESQFSRRSHLGPQAEPQTEEVLHTHINTYTSLFSDRQEELISEGRYCRDCLK